MKLFIFLLANFFSVLSIAEQNPETSDYQLPEISVLGDSSNRSAFDYLPTVTRVSGVKLERKRQATLGETLSREAGVSSSYFGPNASRPVIRGLDGERIRMLENGLGVLDASGASPDHAVSVDPLLVESIEILRGPSALMYGSSAVGGVVNVRTNRIAEKIEENEMKFNTRYTTVDQGRNLGGVSRWKLGNFAFHFDAAVRGSENYKVPGYARADHTGYEKEVVNSGSRASQGAIGTSYIFEDGYVGGALSGYVSNYGTVAEKEVKIDLDRVRFDLAGEVKKLGWIDSLRFKSAYTKYEHKELDSGEVGTIFRNKGVESRVDLKHSDTLFGFQQQYFKFSALGTEAFLPPTDNSSYAGYVFHEWKSGALKPSAGLRADSAKVSSETSANFGSSVSKTYFAPSASLGFQYGLNEESAPQQWTLGLSGTYTERAPNYQEIFANGSHVATGIFEVGDQNMKVERNLGLEFSVKTKSSENEARLATFVQNYGNFIALSPTGTFNNGEDEVAGTDDDIPIYHFGGVRAQLLGAEFEYTQKIPGTFVDGSWEVEFKWDYVRGINLSNSNNLPRMTPMRETLGLNYKHSLFSAELELQRSEAQKVVARGEKSTAAFNIVNFSGEVPFKTGFGNFKVITQLTNIFDVEARNHVSFLKEIAPQPGRSFSVGLQAQI